ncbi:MAG: class I mannose-6-phosphate isomerase [Novosphingobium sp.]|nr:class I mannose-6-phosphate isomerase [Novosphingobium sp.]
MSALPIRQVAKPWGREQLPAPFVAPPGEKIGEIWFEPPPELPSLLVKYIFTSEKLSVQVHPDDGQARAAGQGANGKEECWLVIDAEPGAALGVGFREPISAEAMRAAALDGSIEDMLVWHPVRAGDFLYIPANTVHAIGSGVSLIEVQQNADLTYRLYDYGRPRELHLDQGIAVAKGEPHDAHLRRHVPERGTLELADGRYFRLHRVDGEPDAAMRAAYDRPMLVIPRQGAVRIGGETLRPGSCGYAATISDVSFAPDGQALITHPR